MTNEQYVEMLLDDFYNKGLGEIRGFLLQNRNRKLPFMRCGNQLDEMKNRCDIVFIAYLFP